MFGRPPIEQGRNTGPPRRCRAVGGIPGICPRLIALPLRHVRAKTLRHAKDSSWRVKWTEVEPFNYQRRRRSRPTAKRLRSPLLYTYGQRSRGEAALGDGLEDARFCRKCSLRGPVAGGEASVSNVIQTVRPPFPLRTTMAAMPGHGHNHGQPENFWNNRSRLVPQTATLGVHT
jgi:hypothetical protein